MVLSDTISNSIEMQAMLSQKRYEKKSLAYISSYNSKLSCRICFTGKSKGRLISPNCNCKGTLGLVHRDCMQKWLQVKAIDKCELCNTQLEVKKVNKDFKDWIEQKDNKNRRYLAIDLICVMILTPITFFSSYLCFSGAIYYSQSNCDTLALIALVFLLIMSFCLWICVCLEHHGTAYLEWSSNNYKVILMDKKKLDSTLKFKTNDSDKARETINSLSSRLRSNLEVSQPLEVPEVRNVVASNPLIHI